MKRLLTVLAVASLMAAMMVIAGSAAMADSFGNTRDFDNDDFDVVQRNGDFEFIDENDLDDILGLFCLGAVIDGECFGISTFDEGTFLADNDLFFDDFDEGDNGVFQRVG